MALASFASRRGYEILLVEKNAQVAQESSANSLRIIHGGLRYFQTLNFGRIIRSIKAQEDLLKRYPEHISKLECTLLLPRSLIPPSYTLAMAYNVVTKILTGRQNGALVKPIALFNNKLGLTWNDAVITDYNGLVSSIKSEIKGEILTNTTALEFKDKNTLITDQGELSAESWVLMGGPMCKLATRKELCFGWNLVFKSNAKCAFGVKSNGRFMFIVSRNGEVAAGTWYTESPPSQSEIQRAETEIRELLPEIYFGELLKVELGALPGKTPTDRIEIVRHKTHLEVITPKLTTMFSQAEKVLDTLKNSSNL